MPPGGYHNLADRRTFNTIAEAYRASDSRLLITGAPGSGKSTALLLLAKALAHEARHSPDRPVPFVFNLSTFRFRDRRNHTGLFGLRRFRRSEARKEASPDTQIEDWIVSEMALRPGFDRKTALTWLRKKKFAALIDGLDELDSERRADFVRLLNTTFLNHHAHLSVVICSRTHEYERLKESKETRLALRRCIHLEPLTDEQVTSYLKAGNMTAITAALENDKDLRELAHTPLTVFLLVHAFNGAGADLLRKMRGLSLSERRHVLLETSMARMLQRQARREQGKPYAADAANDIPIDEYRYPSRRVSASLRWLALTLSLRSRTSCQPHALAGLLMEKLNPVGERFNFVALHAAISVFLCICLLGMVPLLAPISASGWAIAASIAAATGLQLPARSPDWWPGSILRTVIWALLVLSGASTTGHAFTTTLHLETSAAPSFGMLIAAVGFMIALMVHDASLDRRSVIAVAVLLGTGVGIFCLQRALPEMPPGSLQGFIATPWIQGTLVSLVIGFGFVSTTRRAMDFVLACIIAAVVGCAGLFVGWVGGPNWIVDLVALTALGTLAMLHPAMGLPYLGVGTVVTAAVGAVSGFAMAVVVVAVIAFAVALSVCLTSSEHRGHRHQIVEWLDLAPFFHLLDRMVLTPILCAVLATTGLLPPRARFISFAKDAGLLKPSGSEVSFTHRLLRDFFALQELMPRTSAEHQDRLEAIRQLGYLGDAATDTLCDLSTAADPRVRAAAVCGLGRLSSLRALPYLRERAHDGDPEVREELVGACWLAGKPGMHVLFNVRPLGDNSEIRGFFKYEHSLDSECWNDVMAYTEWLGKPALEQLTYYLSAPEAWKRDRACRLLDVLFQFPEADSALVAQLHHDPDADVRALIVFLLTRRNSPRAREVNIRARADRSRKVRWMAQ